MIIGGTEQTTRVMAIDINTDESIAIGGISNAVDFISHPTYKYSLPYALMISKEGTVMWAN